MRLFAALVLAPFLLPAADQCEASPEIRQELKRFDNRDVPPGKREEFTRQLADELAAKYPADFFILTRQERAYHYGKSADRTASIERFRKFAAEHPQDPMYSVLYARALMDTDTPKAIELLKKASAHPWAHVALADVYSFGKFSNRPELRNEIEAYFDACPTSLASTSTGMLLRNATPDLAKKYAARFRERLMNETDPDRLRTWETVWNLEFKGRPVPEHEQLRKEIAADLDRLQKGPQGDDEQWLAFLIAGYKLANDSEGATRIEQRLIAQYPKGGPARNAQRERWNKEHPWPKPSEPEEKKQQYYRALLERANQQLENMPDDFEGLMNRFDALKNLKDAKPDEIGAAGEAMIASLRKGADWSAVPPFEWQVAQGFVKNKTRVDQVANLVDEGWKGHRSRNAFKSDRDPDERNGPDEKAEIWLKSEAAKILIDAAAELKNPEIAKAAVAELDTMQPEKPAMRIAVISTKARYAESQGRKLDALLLYRAALSKRPSDMKPAKDELAENVERLFKELGGTAVARDLWENKQGPKIEVAEGGRWSKADKGMPAWDLPDLNGKNWKLASLEGKTVLINVWATWCGPCRQEHPYLEKLYQKVKDRSDIQILTFNVDDEVGKVQPYMQEQKFTFPVLLAKTYVDELLPALSIPRNWIVDAVGKWRHEQIGFGHDENWETLMIEKVEQTKLE